MSETVHRQRSERQPESFPKEPHVGDHVYIWIDYRWYSGTITQIDYKTDYSYCVSITHDDGTIEYVWRKIDQLKDSQGNPKYGDQSWPLE